MTDPARSFPLDHMLAGGRYRIDEHLRGTGSMRLYRGVEVSTGRAAFVSFDNHSRGRQNIDELAAAVGYAAPGVFELAHVGTLDGNLDYWAIVEVVPDGDWLPRVLGPHDPATAPRTAIDLGLSAGRILLRAAEAGVVLAQIRPELMWGRRDEVTGLSARACELFDRHRSDAFTHPLFEAFYRDPMFRVRADDRSVSFALAVMIAEWAMGRYPLRQTFGHETADHDPIEAPEPLRALLERAMQADLDDRPHLADFLVELAAV